jgi:hypothetical protein
VFPLFTCAGGLVFGYACKSRDVQSALKESTSGRAYAGDSAAYICVDLQTVAPGSENTNWNAGVFGSAANLQQFINSSDSALSACDAGTLSIVPTHYGSAASGTSGTGYLNSAIACCRRHVDINEG